MADLVTLAVLVIALWLTVRVIAFCLRRISLFFRLFALRKIEGVSLRLLSPLQVLIPWVPKSPLAEITVGGKTFSIRLMNGGGIGKWLHFASETYAVRFSRMKAIGVSKDLPGERPAGARSLSVGGKIVTLPPLPKKEGVTEVLLFSPMPGVLTYVTDKKTAIRIALTGDVAFGRAVYGIHSFCRMVDRASREYDAKRFFFDE